MRIEKLKGRRFLITGLVFLVLLFAGCPMPETGMGTGMQAQDQDAARTVLPAGMELPAFYRDAGYRGSFVSLQPGFYTTAQLAAAGIRDNDVSSVKVPSGYLVELYDGNNFTGACLKYTSSCPDLYYVNFRPGARNQFNDRMSSVRIFQTVALNSMTSKHQYVSAENTWNSPCIANKNKIGLWESFAIINLGNNKIALRSMGNDLHVCAENGGNSPLVANRAVVGPWETFELINLGNNYVALKSMVNNKYVCAENDGNSPLVANRDVVGPWETFEMVMLRPVTTEPTLAPEMVNVAGGSMTLQGRGVTLTSYKMGKYEVTYELWYDVRKWAENIGGYKFQFPGTEGNDGVVGAAPTANRREPVDNISWHDAIVWCNALSEMEGLTPCYTYNNQYVRNVPQRLPCGNATCNWFATGYRLPTEAEWEYAARGGQLTRNFRFWPGTDNLMVLFDFAWFYSNSAQPTGNRQTQRVGLKLPNELGLYDMAGNLCEWCWDWFDISLDFSGLDPATPPGGYNDFRPRAIRGGSFDRDGDSCKMGQGLGMWPCITRGIQTIRLVKRYGD
ncbi:MAG: hypothetical protein EHM28_06130 [Spirochaetaceae bacterium]|nr:MAG: hypothetical protein EHM28_06130 [Spirochaetaceae bacterium]